ncbi:snoRNA-binding rRNA-processing protein [Tilletia horrida]|nr:snoRNA-binding rRNA-processing protein [Tilletia horrida]
MPRAPSSTKTVKKGTASSSKSANSGKASVRHDPLHAQLRDDELISKYGTVSAPGRRPHKKSQDSTNHGEENTDSSLPINAIISGAKVGGSMQRSSYVDPRLSTNILRLAREQQDEIEREEAAQGQSSASAPNPFPHLKSIRGAKADMPDDDDDDDRIAGQVDSDQDDAADLDDDDDEDFPDHNDEEVYEELEIDPTDSHLLARLGAGGDDDEEDGMGGTGPAGPFGGRRGNLADMIMAKIAEADEAGGTVTFKQGSLDEGDEPQQRPMPPGINPKVIEVYTKVGELLSRYKSGPLPKAFKIIPSLPSWETVLYITNPPTWTPHATFAATKIFVSNLKASQTQKFFDLILLDKFRDEIRDKGKTSYQIYEALKKGLYKPAAFFKGLLFPLCESGTLTLKEAAILASVLTKVSIPVLHSAAALLRLAEMEYTGPTSLLIRVLLDKKYALPYKVVDALVFHFLKFAQEGSGVEVDRSGLEAGVKGERRMPVLWHQSLLVFAQRYKQDLTPDQKAALIDLLRVQTHPGISPEIRRELTTGSARGEMLDEPMDDDDAASYDGVSDIMSV